MALAGEARILHLGDEAAEVPEADGLRRREAFEDLVAGQRRRQAQPAAGGGAVEAPVGVELPLDGVLEQPGAGGQPRRRRLDAGRRACRRCRSGACGPGSGWCRRRWCARPGSPSGRRGRPGAARRPPWRRRAGWSRSCAKSSSTSARPRLIEAATKGLTTATKPTPSSDRRDHRDRDQPQRRDAGGAHHHELAGAGEAQEGDEAREHQDQREDLVEHLRRLQQGDAQHVAGVAPRSRRSGAGSRPR